MLIMLGELRSKAAWIRAYFRFKRWFELGHGRLLTAPRQIGH
jgi:hypothetical protein